ncbi:MAG: class I SAM-dependent methyltransferase [Proteobacteria bacterium]|nr:class I SAM-dependent methyltransferase [Pseudomonadota bacterium]
MSNRSTLAESPEHGSDTVQSSWLASLQTATAYNRWILTSIEPHIRGRTLEIGCGSGTFTGHLAELADHVTAIDIDASFVEQARAANLGRANVTIDLVDATAANWPERFDTAVVLEVIEHIEDDGAVLKSVYRALAPGGRLVLKVPAGPAVFGNIDRAVGHHRRYARSKLVEVLNRSGFADIDCWHFNALGILGWWVNGKLLGRSMPPADQIKAFDILVPALRRIEQTLRPPIGLSLFAVASKPVSA